MTNQRLVHIHSQLIFSFLFTFSFFLFPFLHGCSTSYNVATQRQESLLIDTDREIRMGESVAKQVEKEYTLVRDPELLGRLDRLGQKVSSVSDRKNLFYHFSIIEDEEPNAFALPGGPIYVTTGLLKILPSDEELASVIAHEVGHVVARHAVKRIQGAMGLQFLQILAMGTRAADPQTMQGIDIAFASILTGYSQEDELQADQLGARYLKKSGLDPLAGISALTKIRDYSAKQPLRPRSYFRTHPYFSDRIRMIHQEAEGHMTFDDYINTQK